MANILYGVQGSGHGHAVRALTVARHFPQHQFRFISYGAGAEILRREYPVVDLPGPVDVYRRHQLAVLPSLLNNLRFWPQLGESVRQVLALLQGFPPDAALSDYEFIVPWVARKTGLPCLSFDHQHIVNVCRHPVPLRKLPDYHTMSLVIRLMFSFASDTLVTSFFRPPVRPGRRAKLAPPLLRESVLARTPYVGDFVLAYQGHPTFPEFFDFLQEIPHPVVVYGFNREAREANLRFRFNSETGFLDDLAACRYVVCGGGHTMISEALYYGKPVLSFPIKNAFEQFLNALYLERLGYGRYHTGLRPKPDLIAAFEARLEEYRANLRRANFCGNQEIFALIERFIGQKSLGD